jgi:hypothetical protein
MGEIPTVDLKAIPAAGLSIGTMAEKTTIHPTVSPSTVNAEPGPTNPATIPQGSKPDVQPAVPTPAIASENKNGPPITEEPAQTENKNPPGETVQTTELKGLNTPEAINSALDEAAQVMLKLKDPHLLLVALARQCGDTPMGRELQYDVLQTVRQMSVKDRKIGQRLPLAQLQHKLGELKYPEELPTVNFDKFCTDHKDTYPKLELARAALAGNTGKIHPADLAKEIQKNEGLKDLQKDFYKELMGDKPHDTEAILTAAGIDVRKNLKAIEETLDGTIKQHGGLDRMTSLAIGMMGLGLFAQLFTALEQEQQPRNVQ